VEPFVGSGAVLFWVLNHFPDISKAVINDINEDLINAYKAIQSDVNKLIMHLKKLEDDYYQIKQEEGRKEFFLERREEFNTRTNNISQHSALLIFLNRTCFNGLYRVNSRNKFNVPFGRYKNPRICDTSNLKALNKALQKVTILNTDFTETYKHVEDRTVFFYFDPPYKPISQTSSFNSYSKGGFDDKQQKRLKKFLDKLNKDGFYWLLSNSDPKNIDSGDDFFDKLYKDYFIERVQAKRAINSNANKRGEIAELLIRNYAGF
jgi:DNA adenine methylase